MFHLLSPHLTQEENEITYGKCCLPNGHGHNYTGKVSSSLMLS